MPPTMLDTWISQWLLFICALLVSVIIGLIYLRILRRNQIRNQLPISIEEEYTRQDGKLIFKCNVCLLYTSPSPRDRTRSRMPSSA